MFSAIRCVLNIELAIIILSFISNEYFSVQAEDNKTSVHDAEVQLRQHLHEGYSTHVLPPSDKTDTYHSTIEVHFGVSLILLKDVDPRRRTLTTEVWLKLAWKDDRLKWNESMYSGISSIRVPPSFVWFPDIKLYNNAKASTNESYSGVLAGLYSNGLVVMTLPATLYSICEMDLKYYPYEQHECYYTFASWTHSEYYLTLLLYNNTKEVELHELNNNGGEWEIISTRAQTSLQDFYCCIGSYSGATFFIQIQRRSPLFCVAVVCPVFAVVLLILTTFWISPLAYERISMSGVSLLILVATLLFLTARLPDVGNDVPLIVSFCGLLTILAAFNFITNIMFSCIANSRKNEPLPLWIISVMQSWIPAVFRVTVPASLEKYSNHCESETATSDSDKEQIIPAMPAVEPSNLWIPFFQIIDRFSFVACFNIIIASLIFG